MNRFIRTLAEGTALTGGFVLLALIVMTCVSVTGRSLTGIGLAPIPGDFELVEVGVAFAVFACLPWCQLNRGHATVELLTGRLGKNTNKALDMVIDILMVLVAWTIMRQLYFGTLDKQSYNETSFILGFPIWWAYAISLVGAAVYFIVALYCLWQTLTRTLKVRL